MKKRTIWVFVAVVMTIMVLTPVSVAFLAASPAPAVGVSSSGGGGPASAPSGTSAQVNCPNPCRIVIKNSVFGNGQTVVVAAGTQVIWVNQDDTTHTSTSNSGIWDTGILPVGSSSKPVTFSHDGIFPYFCNVHPMSGVIQVVG